MSGRFRSQLEYLRNPRVVFSMKNGRANFGVQHPSIGKTILNESQTDSLEIGVIRASCQWYTVVFCEHRTSGEALGMKIRHT